MKRIISLIAAAAALALTGSCTKLQPSSLEEDVYKHTATLTIRKIENPAGINKTWEKGTIIFDFDGRIFSKKIKKDQTDISCKVKCSPAGIKSAKATVIVTIDENKTTTAWDMTSMTGKSDAKSIPADGNADVEKITLE